MPAYAGFASLADYVDRRCARDGIARARLSDQLGKPRNYIHGICTGQFSPSLKMCDAIAGYFGDEPHLVRVLAGRESVPPDAGARALADQIMALGAQDRDVLARIVAGLGRSRGKPGRK